MRILSIAFFTLSAIAALAQPKQNSPYSRYGIGDPVPQYFAQHGAMGGLTTAIHDPFHLNIMNPASYAFLRATALETGLYAKYSSYKSASETQNLWSGNLQYFALGFTLNSPINEVLDKKKSKWQHGMAVMLTPASLVGYSVATTGTDPTQPQLGIIKNTFQGNGGAYRFGIGGASRRENTAFGANLGWNFGKATYESTAIFLDDQTSPTNSYSNLIQQEIGFKGFSWNVGAMHDLILQRDPNDKEVKAKWLTFGLTAAGKQNLKGNFKELTIRKWSKTNPNGGFPDTLINADLAEKKINLPGSLSFGATYVEANKLKLGGQFTFSGGENYENEARPERQRNTVAVSLGAEIIPNSFSYNNYLKRVRYRFGGYFRQDPRIVNGKNVDDMGLTLGFGLPLILPRQGTSFVNLAFELGQIGGGTAVKETYGKITVGFTMNDNSWFYKRRFE